MDNSSGTKEIIIRLSNDRSFFSSLTYLTGLGGPTHAAIGLDEADEYVYSFNTRGFKKEYLVPRKKRKIRAISYRLQVSDRSYKLLKERILSMYEDRSSYSYSGLGVALCLMHIPFRFRFEKKYFCSQFVAEILTESGCFNIAKSPELCFPKRIEKEIKNSPYITDVALSGDLMPIYKEVFRYSAKILKKARRSALLYKIIMLHYMKKLPKLCIYILIEQYKDVFSKNDK